LRRQYITYVVPFIWFIFNVPIIYFSNYLFILCFFNLYFICKYLYIYIHVFISIQALRRQYITHVVPSIWFVFNLPIIYFSNYLFILCFFNLYFICKYLYIYTHVFISIQALRRQYITYVVPSIYVAPKTISIQYLDLSRNELDCGDSVLIADILLYQENLKYLDLSFNRMGSRGLVRMCQVLKLHKFIQVFKINHNRYIYIMYNYIYTQIYVCTYMCIYKYIHIYIDIYGTHESIVEIIQNYYSYLSVLTESVRARVRLCMCGWKIPVV
jgi:hypothetical protein